MPLGISIGVAVYSHGDIAMCVGDHVKDLGGFAQGLESVQKRAKNL